MRVGGNMETYTHIAVRSVWRTLLIPTLSPYLDTLKRLPNKTPIYYCDYHRGRVGCRWSLVK